MCEPTARDAARPCPDLSYCRRCDLLVGLDGFHVVSVAERAGGAGPRVVVESPARVEGCRACGVVAVGRGRQDVRLVDAPVAGRPVRLVWRKRSWRCQETACEAGAFTEQDNRLARPRALLTTRACWWAVGQLRREHASVAGLARQLGCSWGTVWSAIRPLLTAMDADPARFAGVKTLGVDEHIWHHTSTKPPEQGGRGPKELTGMVDLTRDEKGRTRARLLDLVPGRSGKAYADWLTERNAAFREGVTIATLDPFRGYKNALDDELEDAIAVLDAFHVVKLGGHAADEVRRRVQQNIHGHRGRSGDPLYGIRLIMRCGQEKLTDRQQARLHAAINADDRHEEVYLAWQCAQQLRAAYQAPKLEDGRKIAEHVLATFPGCPVPEIARLGRTLRQWKGAFLAYFTPSRSNSGGTEAICECRTWLVRDWLV